MSLFKLNAVDPIIGSMRHFKAQTHIRREPIQELPPEPTIEENQNNNQLVIKKGSEVIRYLAQPLEGQGEEWLSLLLDKFNKKLLHACVLCKGTPKLPFVICHNGHLACKYDIKSESPQKPMEEGPVSCPKPDPSAPDNCILQHKRLRWLELYMHKYGPRALTLTEFRSECRAELGDPQVTDEVKRLGEAMTWRKLQTPRYDCPCYRILKDMQLMNGLGKVGASGDKDSVRMSRRTYETLFHLARPRARRRKVAGQVEVERRPDTQGENGVDDEKQQQQKVNQRVLMFHQPSI